MRCMRRSTLIGAILGTQQCDVWGKEGGQKNKTKLGMVHFLCEQTTKPIETSGFLFHTIHIALDNSRRLRDDSANKFHDVLVGEALNQLFPGAPRPIVMFDELFHGTHNETHHLFRWYFHTNVFTDRIIRQCDGVFQRHIRDGMDFV